MPVMDTSTIDARYQVSRGCRSPGRAVGAGVASPALQRGERPPDRPEVP